MRLVSLGGRMLRGMGLRKVITEQEAWRQRLHQLRTQVPWLLGQKKGTRVLYVGASPQRFQMGVQLHDAGYRITLLEAWEPNARFYREHPLVDTVIHGDVCDLRFLAQGRRWDLAIWWHGPEHLGEGKLRYVLEWLEMFTSVGVVLACPWGRSVQGPLGGNPYEVHRSLLLPEDFEVLGYRTATLGKRGRRRTWPHILAWKYWGGSIDERSADFGC